ncbi:hypothetical protein [Streptomyces olivaceiscleroticus]|uniref:hypothetical protein n=1 Tax=Streptomyces olivaceiscleroticus TaxID=68245 RepID=UPI0031F95091
MPIPRTDDYADAARCHACGYAWALDPGANGACATCGGSGIVGGLALWQAPRCPCHEEFSPMAPTGQESRAS